MKGIVAFLTVLLILTAMSCGYPSTPTATPTPTLAPTPASQQVASLEQNYIDLSVEEIYEKLFHSNLTYPQQEELWKSYQGKQIEWTSTLKEKAIREDRLEALFTPYVAVKLKQEVRQTLSQVAEGNLVIYKGTLESYGTNMRIVLLDYGMNTQLILEMQGDVEKGLTWSETLKNHGFNLSDIIKRSKIEFQEIMHNYVDKCEIRGI